MYLNLSAVLKPPEKLERSLRMYPRLRFDVLYYQFDDKSAREYETLYIRKEWKRVLRMLADVNKLVWEIATLHRNTRDWNKRRLSVLHAKIFTLSLKIRELHERLLAVISEEEVVWKNYLFVMDYVGEIRLSKDDKRELNPSIKISSLRLIIRQIFLPLQQLVDSIEQDILNGDVESVDSKLYQLEDTMLLRVLPWFYRMFEKAVMYDAT